MTWFYSARTRDRHYRCHNPNFDCYKLRPELRKWKTHLQLRNGKPEPPGTRNYTFDEVRAVVIDPLQLHR